MLISCLLIIGGTDVTELLFSILLFLLIIIAVPIVVILVVFLFFLIELLKLKFDISLDDDKDLD